MNRRDILKLGGLLLFPPYSLSNDAQEIENHIFKYLERHRLNCNTVIIHQGIHLSTSTTINAICNNLDHARILALKLIKQIKSIEKEQNKFPIFGNMKHVATIQKPLVMIDDWVTVVYPAIIYSYSAFA